MRKLLLDGFGAENFGSDLRVVDAVEALVDLEAYGPRLILAADICGPGDGVLGYHGIVSAAIGDRDRTCDGHIDVVDERQRGREDSGDREGEEGEETHIEWRRFWLRLKVLSECDVRRWSGRLKKNFYGCGCSERDLLSCWGQKVTIRKPRGKARPSGSPHKDIAIVGYTQSGT